MTRVVVAVEGEATMRAAQSLAVHPGIEEVALLGPSQSNHFPTVESPVGWDLVLGSEQAAKAGRHHGIPAAVTGTLADQPGVFMGSPLGLALALAVGVEMVETIAAALPGDPAGDMSIVFPSPIHARPAVVERHDGHDIHVARGPGPLAAVMVLGEGQHRVVLDDHMFLSGIALAAAAVVASVEPPSGPDPVWSRAAAYLRAVVDMGLVIGERSAAA